MGWEERGDLKGDVYEPISKPVRIIEKGLSGMNSKFGELDVRS